MAKIPKITFSESEKATAKRLMQLRDEQMLSAIKGNYKNFRQSSIEYAKEALDNYDITQKLPKQPRISVPIFSKTGMKLLKVWILNMFRVKTPAEKELHNIAEQAKLEEKAKKLMEKYRQ